MQDRKKIDVTRVFIKIQINPVDAFASRTGVRERNNPFTRNDTRYTFRIEKYFSNFFDEKKCFYPR